MLDPTFNGKNIVHGEQRPTGRSSTTPSSTRRWTKARADGRPAQRAQGLGRRRQEGHRAGAAVPWVWDKQPQHRVEERQRRSATSSTRRGTSTFTSLEVGTETLRPAGRARAAAGPASASARHGPHTSSAASSGSSCCCSWSALVTFSSSTCCPSADPARAARRASAEPAARRADPPQARARQADATCSTGDYMRRPGPALRLRLQLPEQQPVRDADLRPPAGDDLADDRRGRHLAVRRPPGRHHLRGPPPIAARPHRDGRRAGRDLGAGLLARARRAVPVRQRHRQVPALPRRRQLRAGSPTTRRSGSRR